MITLIIFLLIISILIISRLVKLKISLKIEVNNLDIFFKIKILKKEIEGKFLLKEKRKNPNTQKKNEKDKPKITLELVKNIVGVLEVKKLRIHVLIGALEMFPTVISVAAISAAIPHVYRLPFKKKGDLKYSVIPIYNTLKLKVNIESAIEVSIYNFLLILLHLRKFKVMNLLKS